jgi:tRNA(Ile)-lysidine synthase
VRADVLPVLESEMGPGVAEALARTASQLAEDTEVLDELAHRALADCRTAQGNLTVDVLSPLPTAIRRRVILQWLLQSGSSGLSAAHIEAVDQLVIAWSGQRDVEVPNVRVARREGEITIDTP